VGAEEASRGGSRGGGRGCVWSGPTRKNGKGIGDLSLPRVQPAQTARPRDEVCISA
jgi:hypothetical protein